VGKRKGLLKAGGNDRRSDDSMGEKFKRGENDRGKVNPLWSRTITDAGVDERKPQEKLPPGLKG